MLLLLVFCQLVQLFCTNHTNIRVFPKWCYHVLMLTRIQPVYLMHGCRCILRACCFIFMSTKVSCGVSWYISMCFVLHCPLSPTLARRGLLKDTNWAHTRTQIHTCQRNSRDWKESERVLIVCVCECSQHTPGFQSTHEMYFIAHARRLYSRERQLQHYNYNQTKIDTVNACFATAQTKSSIHWYSFSAVPDSRSVRCRGNSSGGGSNSTSRSSSFLLGMSCRFWRALLITCVEQNVLNQRNVNMWRAELATGTTKHWLSKPTTNRGCCPWYTQYTHSEQENFPCVYFLSLFGVDLNGIACEYARMRRWEKIV